MTDETPRTIPELYRAMSQRLDQVETRLDRVEKSLTQLKTNAGTLAMVVGNTIQVLNGRIDKDVAAAVKRLKAETSE